jgi:hypothetical protein
MTMIDEEALPVAGMKDGTPDAATRMRPWTGAWAGLAAATTVLLAWVGASFHSGRGLIVDGTVSRAARPVLHHPASSNPRRLRPLTFARDPPGVRPNTDRCAPA